MNKNKITAYKSFTFDYDCLETLINERLQTLTTTDERENTIKDWYIFFKTNINFELYNKYMHKYKSNIATNSLCKIHIDIIKYFDFNRWISSKVKIFKFLNIKLTIMIIV